MEIGMQLERCYSWAAVSRVPYKCKGVQRALWYGTSTKPGGTMSSITSSSLRSAMRISARSKIETQVRYINTVRKGTTYVYQKSMPRLPVPKLEDTVAKYLAAVRPILSPEEFAQTEKNANEFVSGVGVQLHEELVSRDKSNPEVAFITPFWDEMYVRCRDPLPININPYMSFNDDPRIVPDMSAFLKSSKGVKDRQVGSEKIPLSPPAQAARAASLVSASMRFYHALDVAVDLEPEIYHMGDVAQKSWFKQLITYAPSSIAYYIPAVLKSYPLDMRQYNRLFGTTRVPHEEKDEVRTRKGAKHIIALRRGRIYPLRVINDDGSYASMDELHHRFAAIIKHSDATNSSSDDATNTISGVDRLVGVMTGADRDVWARGRQALERSNASNFEQIDSALFAVALDHDEVHDVDEYSRLMLHGVKGRNRWFDKSFTLVIEGRGKAGVNFEHSWGDGVSVLRYMNEIFEDAKNSPVPSNLDWNSVSTDSVSPMQWKIDGEMEKSLRNTATTVEDTLSKLELAAEAFEAFSSTQLKNLKVSPDATCQQAIQLAYWLLKGETAATYESASTAGFRAGRTETIRTATVESQAFCRAMTDPNATAAEKESLFRKACAVHRQLSMEAATGKGMDRHLFAMKAIAEERFGSADLPPFFADPAYTKLNTVILSTSTLMSPAIELGGFGPVSSQGYGIGYGIRANDVGFHVTGYTPDTIQLFQNIKEACGLITSVLQK